MSMQSASGLVGQYESFGRLLKVLRLRARLTQRELGLAVGYSEAQISRMEHGHRAPDLDVIVALFVPALCIDDQPQVIDRLLDLAALRRDARGSSPKMQVDGAGYFPARLLSFLRVFSLRMGADTKSIPDSKHLPAFRSAQTARLERDATTLHINQFERSASTIDSQDELHQAAQGTPTLLVEAHCALGRLACLRGEPDEALEHFQQAVKLTRRVEAE